MTSKMNAEKNEQCSDPGCGRAVHAHGFCQRHYDIKRKRARSEAGSTARRGAADRATRSSSASPSSSSSARSAGSIARSSGRTEARPSAFGTSSARSRATSGSTCTVAGCDAPHHARGFCKSHYSRLRRRGEVTGRARGKLCEIAGCPKKVSEGKRCAGHTGQPESAGHMTRPDRLAEIRRRHKLMRHEIDRVKRTLDKEQKTTA